MKYYIIVGEKSGDLHAANLMREILKQDPEADFRFWGGEAMREVGGTIVHHISVFSLMGFVEVLKGIRKLLALFKESKQDLLAYQPDALILVDFGGFNLRVARFAYQHQFKVFYYISPKVWAWNTKRAYKIKKWVTRMFVIHDFEKSFYQQLGYEVDYVGNPLMDAIAGFKPATDFHQRNRIDPQKAIVAILPGSRRQEIKNILDTLIKIVPYFDNYQFVIAGISSLDADLYASADRVAGISLVLDQTYDVLSHSCAAIVTSGTATLETALFNVPQVVVYKTSFLNYWIARQVAKVKYISLVNLILEREAVKEMIQNDFNVPDIKKELLSVLPGGTKREALLRDYEVLREKVGLPGASARTAQLIVKYLKRS